jgi:hypothetical protein
MKPDPFEQHLSRQPWRPVPPAWRADTLAAAEAGQAHAPVPQPTTTSPTRWLHDWLWPHPAAWAGLAACWVAVLALNHNAAPTPATLAEARAGAQIAQAAFASLRGPAAAEWPSSERPPLPADRPRRSPADQGQVGATSCHFFA